MTKSELIDAVARRNQITKSRAELVVNCVFDSMTAALERGEGIEIRGFGSFTVREYKPYNGRNPRTGRAVPVPEKRLPFFKVGKELKELVNAGVGAIETDDDDHDDDDSQGNDSQGNDSHGNDSHGNDSHGNDNDSHGNDNDSHGNDNDSHGNDKP